MITTAPELIYMLKVNIGIALFYAFYKLFCCRDTFFQWRRIALLSFLALSFLYPLMDMQAWVKEQPAINELADYYTLMMLTETNTSTATVVTTPVAIPTPGLLDIIKFIYWIGILLLSARFMIQLSSIFHLVLKSKSINVDQISIRSLSEPANPFERLIYSTEESTPRPEREEVASFVNTVQGLVTFTITVTNSEGKPQPNVTLQIKPSDEVKTFKTNAEGKATIEVDMTTPKYVSLDVSSPKSSKHQSLLLSANKPNVTAIFDTDDDIAAYIKAGKQIRVKLQISNNDNQQLAGAELISSSTNAKATTNAHGEAQLTVGVGETIAINHKGYQEGKFTVKELCPIKDMENPELVRLLLVGEDPVYQIADNMPEFPGGMAACLQHLARNIKYPTTAQKEGTQGKVIVQMVIEKDGSVDHVSIVRSISPELDAEAARVVKSMPKWKPATVKDKTVRCRYTVPVTFKLQ